MTDSAPAPDAGVELVKGRLMKASLAALLDRVRGSREALPHLAALETALGARGAGAIEATPERWRSRMCAQLSSLPLPDDDRALLDLQQRLLASLAPRPPAAPLTGPLADPAFDPERTVVVREISHSEFMNLSEGTPRTGDGPARPDPGSRHSGG